MIRIVKQATAPKKLRTTGVEETDALKAAYDKSPAEYQAGTKTLGEFKSSVFGHRTVKTMLLRSHHNKCCFCESKVTHVAYGDVEHFRPKAGYRQKKGDALGKPGYYWLAYDWDNLFFSCQICNQRYKKNLFPLENPAERAVCHHDAIEHERPMFLNPSEDDAENHIGFRQEYPYAIGSSSRAVRTIELLGLDREALVESRRDVLTPLMVLIDLCRRLVNRYSAGEHPSDVREQIEKIEVMLRLSVKPSAQYSSMAKAAIGDLLQS